MDRLQEFVIMSKCDIAAKDRWIL